jgi:hypothetical protein
MNFINVWANWVHGWDVLTRNDLIVLIFILTVVGAIESGIIYGLFKKSKEHRNNTAKKKPNTTNLPQ